MDVRVEFGDKRLPQRFWSKVRVAENGCWEWIAYIRPHGYGMFGWHYKAARAHVLSYQMLIGAVPTGMELDHLCHNADASCTGGNSCRHRRCVNPGHLEPVTRRQNLNRSSLTIPSHHRIKTHCPKGHPYDETNTAIYKGSRNCRVCHRAESLLRNRWRDGYFDRHPEDRP